MCLHSPPWRCTSWLLPPPPLVHQWGAFEESSAEAPATINLSYDAFVLFPSKWVPSSDKIFSPVALRIPTAAVFPTALLDIPSIGRPLPDVQATTKFRHCFRAIGLKMSTECLYMHLGPLEAHKLISPSTVHCVQNGAPGFLARCTPSCWGILWASILEPCTFLESPDQQGRFCLGLPCHTDVWQPLLLFSWSCMLLVPNRVPTHASRPRWVWTCPSAFQEPSTFVLPMGMFSQELSLAPRLQMSKGKAMIRNERYHPMLCILQTTVLAPGR